MAKKRITTASAKDKGRRLQKWVMEKISELTGYPCGKDELIASREMGQTGTDIRLIGPAKEKFPFAVECKYQERWALPEWIQQAKANTSEDLPDWLLFIKKNRSDPIVVMDADLFFRLLSKCQDSSESNSSSVPPSATTK